MSDDTTGPASEPVARDGAATLFVADFDDTGAAWQAYEALTAVGAGRHVDGVVVVTREAGGGLRVQQAGDHSSTTGLRWGLVGGAALGILFPPTLLGSAVVLGGAGAAVDRARRRHHRRELAERLEYAVAPGHCGVVAIVSDRAAPEVRAALAGANAIVESVLDDRLAADIRALARDGDRGATTHGDEG